MHCRFWSTNGFLPVYLRQTTVSCTLNCVTVFVYTLGNVLSFMIILFTRMYRMIWLVSTRALWSGHYERGSGYNTTIKVRVLLWALITHRDYFSADFRKRMLSLLAYQFREFPPSLSLSLLQNKHSKSSEGTNKLLSPILPLLFYLLSITDLWSWCICREVPVSNLRV